MLVFNGFDYKPYFKASKQAMSFSKKAMSFSKQAMVLNYQTIFQANNGFELLNHVSSKQAKYIL